MRGREGGRWVARVHEIFHRVMHLWKERKEGEGGGEEGKERMRGRRGYERKGKRG